MQLLSEFKTNLLSCPRSSQWTLQLHRERPSVVIETQPLPDVPHASEAQRR